MCRRQLGLCLAAAVLALPAGCATGGVKGLFARSGTSGTAEKNELSPEFRRAQKMFKNTEGTMLAWARYQEDLGEYAEARKKYRELLIAYPDCTEASLGLARIERETGRWAQSQEILSALEAKEPENRRVKLEVGRLYVSREDWPEAIAAFKRAAELDPEDQECRYELGVALAKSGQFEAAVSHLTFAVGEPAAHYNIGYILHEQGRDADAIAWFRNALQSHPDEQTEERTRAILASLLEDQRNNPLNSRLASSQPPRVPRRQLEQPAVPMQSVADRFQPDAVVPGSTTRALVQRPSQASQSSNVATVQQSLPAVDDFVAPAEEVPAGSRRTMLPVSWSSEAGNTGTGTRLPPSSSPAAGSTTNVPVEPPLWKARQQ
jgi:Flp pilus assembly protein TadD